MAKEHPSAPLYPVYAHDRLSVVLDRDETRPLALLYLLIAFSVANVGWLFPNDPFALLVHLISWPFALLVLLNAAAAVWHGLPVHLQLTVRELRIERRLFGRTIYRKIVPWSALKRVFALEMPPTRMFWDAPAVRIVLNNNRSVTLRAPHATLAAMSWLAAEMTTIAARASEADAEVREVSPTLEALLSEELRTRVATQAQARQTQRT